MRKWLTLLLVWTSLLGFGQHHSKIDASLDAASETLQIEQELEIFNYSDQAWNEVYLMDWANAFSSIETPLAIRFAEDFKNKFQFSPEENKGSTFSFELPLASDN